jgi:hypothetical protein
MVPDPLKRYFKLIETISRLGRIADPFAHSAAAKLAAASSQLSATQELAERLNPAGAVQRLHEKIEQLAEPFSALERLQQLHRALTRFEGMPERLSDALVSAGYSPHPELTLPDVALIVEAFEEEGPDAAVEVVERIYDEMLADERFSAGMHARWDAIPGRGDVLMHCLLAYEQGLYGAMVPSLIAQVEGMILDATDFAGWVRGDTVQAKLAELLDEDDVLTLATAGFLGSVLHHKFHHGDEPMPPLSRHAILHGGDTGFATKRHARAVVIWTDCVALLIAEGSDEGPAEPQEPSLEDPASGPELPCSPCPRPRPTASSTPRRVGSGCGNSKCRRPAPPISRT